MADNFIAGVDEAGRGCMAGPVIAAAVILDPAYPIKGLADSKQLSAKKRETMAIQIKQYALAYAIGQASVEEIDEVNILQATFLAMRRAIMGLNIPPKQVIIDGNQAPKWEISVEVKTEIKGDQRIPSISAASILAKVTRDEIMCELDDLYPDYGFSQHKGYVTKGHQRVLKRLGPIPMVHRLSFAPVVHWLR